MGQKVGAKDNKEESSRLLGIMEKAFELNLVGRLGPIHAGPGERNFRWKPTHRYGGHKQAEHGYDGK